MKIPETAPLGDGRATAACRSPWYVPQSPAGVMVAAQPNWTEIATFWVLLATLIVLGIYAWDTRKMRQAAESQVIESQKLLRASTAQTETAMEAAGAARENALTTSRQLNAYIESQRGRLVVSPNSSPPVPDAHGGFVIAACSVTLRNVGITPAIVVGYFRDRILVPRLGDLQPPQFPDSPNVLDIFVGASTEHVGEPYLEGFSGESELAEGACEAVKQRGERLCFYGRVGYKDIFTDNYHETRFGYFWNPTRATWSVIPDARFNAMS